MALFHPIHAWLLISFVIPFSLLFASFLHRCSSLLLRRCSLPIGLEVTTFFDWKLQWEVACYEGNFLPFMRIAVQVRSFDDVPFLLDWKLRHFLIGSSNGSSLAVKVTFSLSHVAVGVRSFDDVPFLLDRKFRTFFYWKLTVKVTFSLLCVAVRARSFNDVPFLLDRKLPHFFIGSNNGSSLAVKLSSSLHFFDVNVESPVIPIWVSFPNLRPHFFSPRILHRLGLLFCRPLKMDNAIASRSHPSITHIFVKLDITKCYSDRVWLGPEKFGYVQYVEMEVFLFFCSHYKSLGHSNLDCHVLHPPPTVNSNHAKFGSNETYFSADVGQDNITIAHSPIITPMEKMLWRLMLL
ncbi:hypothetical protein IEQ34_014151 [Dendrobium chrysotoxum]|uniref:DUF4283 domain-containing protein n=1 Tax=Dendrobium chrysotoxum TaxID=161865 RepID=A0AAV7GKN9_DENCH|nr:hypothetical protein IEQ34_014151 [Dendrobium chrysotoxum]